jgi:DHA2 family multidrug resistance protein-like MFS transporter
MKWRPVDPIYHADGVPMPARLWAILSIMLGMTMAVMDSSIANIALPTIARDLQTSPAASIWVVNAYQLAVTVSLLPLASLGDIFGYRRVYLTGFAVFTLASLACALSDSLVSLTAARIVQGFGGAGIMSVNTALIRHIYPRHLMGRGFAINATVASVSSAVGPTVASAILSVAAWPYLFAVNVPIGAIALLVGLRALPFTRGSNNRFDGVSAALSAATFGLLITGLDGLAHGQAVVVVVFELVMTVAAGYLLVRRQLSRPAPLLPVDLLRIPLFALSVVTGVSAFIAQSLAFVSLPFYFENTLQLSQVTTGMLMTPWPLTMAVVAQLSGRLADRYSAGLLGGIGLAVLACGLFLLVALPAHPSIANIVWRTSLCGMGFGFFNTPNNRAMQLAAPRSRAGGASGVAATARLLGQTIGAALVALIFTMLGMHGTVGTLVAAGCFACGATLISLTRLGENV